MNGERVEEKGTNEPMAAAPPRLSASWPGMGAAPTAAPSSGADAVVARLDALERRLATFEEAGASGRPNGRQEPLENRITLLEQRFSLLDEDALALGERVDALESAARAQTETAPVPVTPPAVAPTEPIAPEIEAGRDEAARDEIARLTTRLAEMESDLRSTVERVSILRASELVSLHDTPSVQAGADPREVEDLRRELGELRAAVEALVMALSLGLGRHAA